MATSEAGQGVARAIKEGLVKRSDLFLVSKLWNTFHDHDRVAANLQKAARRLGHRLLRPVHVHFPISLKYVDPSVRYPPGFTDENDKVTPGKATIQETWTAMEKLVDAGLAKSIGISNFNGQLILDLLRYAEPARDVADRAPPLSRSTRPRRSRQN